MGGRAPIPSARCGQGSPCRVAQLFEDEMWEDRVWDSAVGPGHGASPGALAGEAEFHSR